jgi:hypothetical protein
MVFNNKREEENSNMPTVVSARTMYVAHKKAFERK